MTIPITQTQVIIPRRPANLITRNRLLQLLYNLLDLRIVSIAAPAGYGKTLLLIDLAHHVEFPVCWYALDSLDQDPQRFIAHFIASIRQQFADFGQRSMVALHSMHLDKDNTSQLATIIANDAYEHIREHFAIVLDDYHLVDNSPMVNHFVNCFAQRMDENCHLLFASRTLLKLPDLPLMVARSQVGGLGVKELAFSALEIQSLVLQNYHLTMPIEAAEKLAQKTEGWITALLLSAQTMWQGMTDRVRLAQVSDIGLYDYLAQQVLDQQPAQIRDFLLRTSLLEEFDAELCQAVFGAGQDWHRLVESVSKGNLFVLPVDNQGTWLRYHQLFCDFLQTRLLQERPQEQKRILRRLAAVYLERQEWEKAHKLYRRLDDLAATIDLIEQAGESMVKNGRLDTLANWLDALPVEALNTRPALLARRGIVDVMLGKVESGLTRLNKAVAAFRASKNTERLVGTLVWRATAHRFLGDYQASLTDADQALAFEQTQGLRALQAEALRVKGLSLYRMGGLAQAIEYLENSLSGFMTLGDEPSQALLFIELGLIYMNSGNYEQALEHYQNALSYWQRVNHIVRQATVLNNLGVLYHLKGDYEQASLFLEQALDCARQSGYTRMETLALSSIGDLYVDLENLQAAQNAFNQAYLAAQKLDDRFLLLYTSLAKAALARSQSDWAQANHWLQAAKCFVQQSSSAYEQALWQAEAGRLALAQNDSLSAIAHLGRAAQSFERGGQRAESDCVNLFLAAAYYEQQDPKAFTHLRRSLESSDDLPSRHKLVIAGRQTKELLHAAAASSDFVSLAARLLRQIEEWEHNIPAWRKNLRQQTSVVPFGPPKLSIRALGHTSVLLDGKTITDVEWQSRKTVRDFFFLLIARPQGFSKERIGLCFWPEHSSDELKHQFKNVIYRLRRALGKDIVLFDQGIYSFNRCLDYEYDVEMFEAKIAQANADPQKRIAAYQQAIELYRGPYLPGMEGTWVLVKRERLWRMYTEAVLNLAESCLQAQQCQKTLNYCQLLLEQDTCLEQAHRLVMRAYAAIGNQAAVARQFQSCTQALSKEVGVSPSIQTKTLYNLLVD